MTREQALIGAAREAMKSNAAQALFIDPHGQFQDAPFYFMPAEEIRRETQCRYPRQAQLYCIILPDGTVIPQN